MPGDFRQESFAVPACPEQGVLLRGLYLSIDPYMRGRMDDRRSYARPTALGDAMPGECVAEVVESRHPGLARGDVVLAKMGWVTHASLPADAVTKLAPALVPVTTRLGVLGMPGFTAYAGLELLGKPRPEETVVVAAASGPVGSLVGQLARRRGARAVGIAGGPEKCRYLTEVLGLDAAVDHRSPDFPERLRSACPGGIDVYFENVGGAVWDAVLPLLNDFARVPVSGLIAEYNGAHTGATDRLPATLRQILSRSLTIRGFINFEFAREHFGEFLNAVAPGVADGSIRYREQIHDGLESAPEALIGMLQGRNFGKVLIRL